MTDDAPGRMTMATGRHSEIEATLSGKTYKLCLTLGALAEIEGAYGGEDLIAIAERFETGSIRATDAIRLIGAGLRGGGNVISDDEVAAMTVDGGATGYLEIVVRLLKATFQEVNVNTASGFPLQQLANDGGRMTPESFGEQS